MGHHKQTRLKKDGFRAARGGRARWLLCSCESCDSPILLYQKDGPGILKRLYLDRIEAPKSVTGRKQLICGGCRTLLGIPMIYAKEKRPAFRLFAGAMKKRVVTERDIDRIVATL